MAECLVIPLVISPSALAVSGPATEAEAEGMVADFVLEELRPEDETEAPDIEAADVPAQDPLQMLIEDLSGITGTLREAAPRSAGKATPAGAEAMEAETMSRPSVPVTVDAAPADLVPVDATPLESALADVATPEGEALVIDPALPGSPVPRSETAAPAEMRPARASAPVPVARQIAEAVVTTRDNLVEIALAPEELGRIRMVLSGPEQNPHVMIWVERPEVLDQLRRNSAFLQECFGDAGMADASFEFSGETPSGSRDDRPAPTPRGRPGCDAAEQMQVIPLAWVPTVIPARLDIRI